MGTLVREVVNQIHQTYQAWVSGIKVGVGTVMSTSSLFAGEETRPWQTAPTTTELIHEVNKKGEPRKEIRNGTLQTVKVP